MITFKSISRLCCRLFKYTDHTSYVEGTSELINTHFMHAFAISASYPDLIDCPAYRNLLCPHGLTVYFAR